MYVAGAIWTHSTLILHVLKIDFLFTVSRDSVQLLPEVAVDRGTAAARSSNQHSAASVPDELAFSLRANVNPTVVASVIVLLLVVQCPFRIGPTISFVEE